MESKFRPRAVVFDLDGTLVNNMRTHIAAWIALLHDNGLDITVEGYYASGVAGKAEDAVTHFLGSDLAPDHVRCLAEQKEFLYRFLVGRKLKPIRGVPSFLRRLKALGLPLAIATAAGRRNAEFQVDVLNFAPFIQTVVTADDVRVGKPDPELFLTAAARLGIAPEHCLAFEDTKPGIEAARRAGMRCVAITTAHSREELEPVPGVVLVIDDYRDARLLDLIGIPG